LCFIVLRGRALILISNHRCGVAVPGVGLTPVDKLDKDHVSRALSMAQTSTASMGKFDESLPKEKSEKQRGKKRKVCLAVVTHAIVRALVKYGFPLFKGSLEGQGSRPRIVLGNECRFCIYLHNKEMRYLKAVNFNLILCAVLCWFLNYDCTFEY